MDYIPTIPKNHISTIPKKHISALSTFKRHMIQYHMKLCYISLEPMASVGKHITTFRNYMLILRYVYVLETHYHPLFLYNEDYVKVVLYLLFSSLSSSMIFSTLSSRQMNGIRLWKALCLLMIFVSSLKQKLIYENWWIISQNGQTPGKWQ